MRRLKSLRCTAFQTEMRIGVALIALAAIAAGAVGQSPLREIRIDAFQVSGTGATLKTRDRAVAMPGARVLVTDGTIPAGIFSFETADDLTAVLRCPAPWTAGALTARARGWLLDFQAFEQSREHWPTGIDLVATVDSVGPGGESAWIAAGSERGIVPGDTFWFLNRGQPLATVRVRYSVPGLALGRVTPLAEGAQVRPGDLLRLWPRPSDTAARTARSAVCFVERESGMLWVAAPPRGGGNNPDLDLYRDGEFIGFAVVERRDDRFWYARPQSSTLTRKPAVGDEVRIRTSEDVRLRRFVPRIFDQSAEGCYITAGEPDGITAGEVATVTRSGHEQALVRVVRVQGSYSIVIPVGTPAEPPAVLDEVHFRPPPAPEVPVGDVSESFGDEVFQAQLTGSRFQPGDWCVLRDGTNAVAAGIVVAMRERELLGVVIPGTLTGTVHTGEVVVPGRR